MQFSTIVRGLALATAALCACTVQRDQPDLTGQDLRVTFIHTSDIHSRLFPYEFVPVRIDQDFGLDPKHGPFGGIARMGAIIKEERAKASRSLWLDSGDCFQGAPVFNVFKGEAEFRALSLLGLDGAVIGNHEFDLGSNNLYDQIVSNAGFPLLAANYYFVDPTEPNKPKLKEVVQPYQLYDLDGVIVAAIGMANWSSMTGIFEGGNSLGVRPLDDEETVDRYVRLLRPVADVVVLVSHLGLEEDEGLAGNEVEDMNMDLDLNGVDLVLGGHLHIVLNPPKVKVNSDGHQTVVVHSGAFAKYVGRLDLVVHKGEDNSDPRKRSFIKAFSYDNIPVSCGGKDENGACKNPEDLRTLELLRPYSVQLNALYDLDGVFAYVMSKDEGGKIVRNHASGGDSQLGNLVARAMQRRRGVDADFALTNTLGIRADFEAGPLDLEQMFNVFPFENSITVMFLSGVEIQATLDFVARKSNERGCRTQVQVAGITFTIVCGQNPRAEDIYIGDDCREDDGEPRNPATCAELLPDGLYRVAVNDYIAAGGSGFDVLKANTSKQNTGIALRAALTDYLRNLDPCVDAAITDKYGAVTCLSGQDKHDNRIFTRFE